VHDDAGADTQITGVLNLDAMSMLSLSVPHFTPGDETPTPTTVRSGATPKLRGCERYVLYNRPLHDFQLSGSCVRIDALSLTFVT